MDSLISIIVPVYNVEAYLPECVRSILNQTFENWEMILVDDGSRDASGQICEEFAREDSRIRVIHKPNGGLSSARNAGIEVASGEYLAFVDSDDWLEPESLQWMLARAEESGAPMVCGGRYDFDDATGERTLGLCPERDEVVSGEELVRRIFTWDHLDSAAWDKLYRAELFVNHRYPEGKICEDVPLTYRIALEAGRVALLAKPIYNYRHRPQSITTACITEKSFHFPGHTAEIYPWICREYPALAQEAEYLRVRSLVHPLIMMEIDDGDARERFSGQYHFLRRELRRHAGFVARSSLFSGKEKRDVALLVLGLYRPAWRFHSWRKGRA